MLTLAASILLVTAYTCYRQIQDVHRFQQLSYRPERYFRWLNGSNNKWLKDSDIVLLFSVLFTVIGTLVPIQWVSIPLKLIGMSIIGFSWFMLKFRNDIQATKKALIYTDRVKRLFVAITLVHICILAIAFLPIRGGHEAPVYYILITSVLLPVITNVMSFGVIFIAFVLTLPIEEGIKRYYIHDAKRRLALADHLKIIGITGSYGKTSVKNILTQMLTKEHVTLMTPESYNTTLGVVRTIREKLKPYHDVLVLEMGAKEPGDIAEICDVASPHLSVVTSVGPQHLETFGSVENVLATKTEIFRGTVAGGTCFLNLADPLLNGYYEQNKDYGFSHKEHEFVTYGTADSDYAILKENVSPKGTSFTLRTPDGCEHDFTTKLLGQHNVENVMLCAAIALHLGVSPDYIRQALYDVQPIKHRLSVQTSAFGYTVLDDAFNSNPVGSKNALKVLKAFPGGKKCVMTPGMIELGEQHHALNRIFGETIAETCDYAVLVGIKQTQPIQEGLEAKGFPKERIFLAEDLRAAFETVNQLLKPGDVLLIENDLPDIFNETA